ncbi:MULTISPECIES: hypothetical protein [Thiorhodovibrio]|uniref:hypothetical protein n=1 Tax=Thiorhodovibrio TaxID=61593 RepID=UPI001F5E285F|nr:MULTISPECIES: hypothetical protein [Thiorhodovibrio]WPL13986.1 hypothetical protein Thiosp_03815 [Thiorhodovibrio litoralis]
MAAEAFRPFWDHHEEIDLVAPNERPAEPIGNSTALALLERGLPLLAIDNWTQGNNRIVFPYLQPAKWLAMIEAVVGLMFVAVFLARLVGVRTSSH